MRTVLAQIQVLGQRHARRAFFDFLRDPSFAPHHRLAFLPAIAPYVVGQDDLHRQVLRYEPAADGLQRMVNDHLCATDHAATMAAYRADLARLGLLPTGLGTPLDRHDDAAMAASRRLGLRLAHLGWSASPALRLALLECIEAADAVLFGLTMPLAAAHRSRTGIELPFCAGRHRLAPSGRARIRGWSHEHLAAVVLGPAERDRATSLVADAFSAYDRWSDTLVGHAGLQATLLGLHDAVADTWPLAPAAAATPP